MRKIKNFNKILVVDIESTCWEPSKNIDQSEIIEFGYCLLDIRTGEKEKGSRIVKPALTYPLSDFCKSLTNLTDEEVYGSNLTFRGLCDWIKANYRDYTWASYGDYDRVQFERQCRRENVQYPFGRTHLNIKYLFSLFNGKEESYSEADALAYYDLDFEGQAHRGGDDAYNAARVLYELVLCP
jgi:inhibitor of KinA sporulation pathway (predicted exonuclease)